MNLTLGFSPCPNDTYIFGALVLGYIDTHPYQFTFKLADVEELNQRALSAELDITKLSFHALTKCLRDYVLLESGSALGRMCGPLLICKPEFDVDHLHKGRVAVPGELTTANFLLDFYTEIGQKEFVLFDEIEDSVLSGRVDAGVIIHENRFTFKQRGLTEIIDLGQFWEDKTGSPIPLGGIAAKRSLGPNVTGSISALIRASLLFARNNEELIMPYVRKYAQEMEEEVMKRHIGLYVNDFSIQLGKAGKSAIDRFLIEAKAEFKGPLFF